MNPLRRLFGRSPAPEFEAAARGKRARDHLARKRERERLRLERARHQQEIRQNRRRILNVLTPVLFVVATGMGVAASRPVADWLLYQETPLERVAVQGAAALSPGAIAAGAGLIAGIPLDTLDPQSVRAELAKEPWIESSRTLRLPTGTLVVSVVERHAVARWRIADSETIELVDERGGRFAGAVENGGPLPLVQGAAAEAGALPADALEILRETKRHASLAARPAALILHLPTIAAADGSTSGYVLQLGKGGPQALLGRRLLPQRVARLAALLDEDRAMVRTARMIDLRYADRAVLRTEPSSG